MNHISKKSITVSIILLFIGVSVSSGISVDTESTSVEDCDCDEVDEKHIQFLERHINKLEVYSKLLSVLSKFNPELKEISEDLFYEISTLKNDFTNDRFPIICETLVIIWYSIGVIAEIVASFSYDLQVILFHPILFMIYSTAKILECDWVI